MNEKAAKRLRREMRVLLGIDPREATYISRGTRGGAVPLDAATGLFLVPAGNIKPRIKLMPGCGRAIYREAKRAS